MADYTFTKATKQPTYARFALMGASGTGKTYTALEIAQGLCPTGRIAVIDTEHGVSRYYADVFDFDILILENHHPDEYRRAMLAAHNGGYDVLIVDSITHEWEAVKDLVDQLQKKMDKRKAWAQATPLHNKFVEAVARTYPGHVISTVRTDRKLTANADGTVTMQLQPSQRENIEYEFDILLDIDHDHVVSIVKSRMMGLNSKRFRQGQHRELGELIGKWALGNGTPATSNVAFTPATVPDEEPAQNAEISTETPPQVQTTTNAVETPENGNSPAQVAIVANTAKPTREPMDVDTLLSTFADRIEKQHTADDAHKALVGDEEVKGKDSISAQFKRFLAEACKTTISDKTQVLFYRALFGETVDSSKKMSLGMWTVLDQWMNSKANRSVAMQEAAALFDHLMKPALAQTA